MGILSRIQSSHRSFQIVEIYSKTEFAGVPRQSSFFFIVPGRALSSGQEIIFYF
ncbi:hypothetical protein LEP1GSC124_0313 [Leptospira interrogans serovar Pyrogenes str. 200701872]|uniref:Uncharacterized protein n=1 Tax=Leptospira interrogans serovar Pyrogenes str. 200701872 TaxID=1193029 RepID=M6ZKC6_LEPIR|nr:hypothetical protein LEP1GSC124_0313 [Leptospira interrogans serovar Pyrogenes str. 200701872]